MSATANATAQTALSPAAESLLASGHVKYKEQEFESARDLWLATLPRARAAGDSTLMGELYTWLGLAAYRLGDLDSARTWETRALDIKSRIAAPYQLWRTYNALGLMALDENMNDSAAALFEKGGEVATRARDAEGVAKTTGNAALAYSYLGDLERARAGHRTMRSAGRRLDDPKVEANGLANEAMVDIWEGDAPIAILRLDTARVIYRRTRDAVGEANALGQLATAYQLVGDFRAAFAALDSALAVTTKHKLSTNKIEILRLLGALHSRLGDHRRALSVFGEAEKIARDSEADSDLASILRGSAAASFRLGNMPRARSQVEEALRLHRAAEEPLDQIDDLLLLAEFESQTGARAAAARRLREASALASASENPAARATVVIAQARQAEAGGDPRRAIQLLRDIGQDSIRVGFDLRATAAGLSSRAFLRINAVDSAIAAGNRAVSAVERVRADLGSSAMKSVWIADRSQIYSDHIVALLRAGRTTEAFAVADRARSRALIENLGAIRNQRPGEGVAPELLQSERMLRRVDALMEALSRTSPPRSDSRGRVAVDAAHPIVERLAAARAEYERLHVRGAQQGRGAAVMNGSLLDVSELRAALEPGEAMVEYYLGSDSIFAFVVTREQLLVTRAHVEAGLIGQRLRLLKELWGSPRRDWSVGLGASRALHETLLAPVRNAGLLRGARRLVIVPHGVLAQVPYAGLQNPQTGRFLIEEYDIGQAPSAAAFVALRRRASYSDESATSAAFAPFGRELPGTLREVAALAATYPSVAVLKNEKATERELRRRLSQGGIVHIASHGVLNHLNPMFSRVELASGARRPIDNGRLEVHELLGLSVRSPLVFLSGCETGASEEWTDGAIRMTGDLTLSQAFLSAGALNVASTLWRIDDDGAAVIAGRFYAAARKIPVFEALSGTQRSLVRDPRFGSPYYWAGYVISGGGRHLNASQKIAAASVQ